MVLLMVIKAVCKRTSLLVIYYCEYFISHPWIVQLKSLITMSSIDSSLVINSSQSLLDQLNEAYLAADSKLNANEFPDLSRNCQVVHEGAKKLFDIAKLYDYDNVQANGYWTFIKIIIKFGKGLVSQYQRGKGQEDQFLAVSKVLSTGVELCNKFHAGSMKDRENDHDSCDETPNSRNNLFTVSVPFTELLKVFQTLAPQLDVVYGQFCAYWLCPSMRRSMQGFSTIMALYAGGSKPGQTLHDRLMACKTLWDRTHRAQIVAHIAQNATVEFVKSFWGLTELSIFKNALPSLALKKQPKVVKDVFIPRQQEWIISNKKAEVFKKEGTFKETKNEKEGKKDDDNFSKSNLKVRCRLLQNDSKDNNKNIVSVVLHIHGGGFVSQSPDSHEIYLRDWTCKLNGVPILSVDYSLSPEARYPVALQEILDVYLWLLSEHESVTDILGFQPQNVVVCGDSAGGNMTAALCLILNDIQKQIGTKNQNFQLPSAAVCFYTPFMLKTLPSPSRLLTAVDTLLPLGVLLSCLEAYFPHPTDEDQPSTKTKSTLKEGTQQLKVTNTKLSPITPTDGVSEGEAEAEPNKFFEYASLHFSQSVDHEREQISAKEDETTEFSENDCEFEDFVHITYDDVPPDEDLLFQAPNDRSFKIQRQFSNTYRRIRESFIGTSEPIPEPKPWYRTDEASLNVKLEQLNYATSNPYISPFFADFDFDSVPLYLVALHYDACLDDSIMMAKKWKGPVVLDVIDDLPHGFLNFVLLSEEGKAASDLCVSRLKQALATE